MTAARWMRYLGYELQSAGKNYYVDGHERADVVADRTVFIAAMEEIEKQMLLYDDNMNPIPFFNPDGKPQIVLITHDETTLYANDATRLVWMLNGKRKIKPKSNGSSLMISGFMCDCHGFLHLNGQKSYETFEFGKNRDGAWTNDNLIEQLEKVIEIFKQMHPDCELLFLFDNSQNHHKKAPDGLDADSMNLNPGGKQKRMRDTKTTLRKLVFSRAEGGLVEREFPDSIQRMVDDHNRPKGIKNVLSERGEWKEGMNLICNACTDKKTEEQRIEMEEAGCFGGRTRKYCCARYVMKNQPDFLAQREWLREIVEDAECKIMYYPKYHCELNYIEMVWAYIKQYARRHCTYSFEDLKELVPIILESKIDIKYVRRVKQKCFRYMSGYREGIHGPLLDYAVKKYSSHRRIPSEAVKIVETEFDMKVKEKSKQRFYEKQTT